MQARQLVAAALRLNLELSQDQAQRLVLQFGQGDVLSFGAFVQLLASRDLTADVFGPSLSELRKVFDSAGRAGATALNSRNAS